MKFYTFSQNNSGGFFTGPAEYVIIEAQDAQDANRRAEEAGLYFNGCESGSDCPCCGDRWSKQWSDDYGDAEPMIYGKPVAEAEAGFFRSDVFIVYADGRQETVQLQKKDEPEF